jgi:peptidoglycan/LPS O-acetylase OafA/YrhL
MQLDAVSNPEGSHFLTKTIFLNLFSGCIALLMPYFSSVKKATVPFIGKAVTHISLISYSLYLIHTMAIHIYLTGHYILKFPNYPALKFIDSWIVCIIVATFMYRFIEKPFTNMRERYKLKPVSEPVRTS